MGVVWAWPTFRSKDLYKDVEKTNQVYPPCFRYTGGNTACHADFLMNVVGNRVGEIVFGMCCGTN